MYLNEVVFFCWVGTTGALIGILISMWQQKEHWRREFMKLVTQLEKCIETWDRGLATKGEYPKPASPYDASVKRG